MRVVAPGAGGLWPQGQRVAFPRLVPQAVEVLLTQPLYRIRDAPAFSTSSEAFGAVSSSYRSRPHPASAGTP